MRFETSANPLPNVLGSLRFRSESRHLQHQRHQQTAAEPFGVAVEEQADVFLTGTQGGAGSVPAVPCKLGLRQCGKVSVMEWCRDSLASRAVLTRLVCLDAEDTQARYIEAAVNGVLIACIYLPNGNPQPGPKFSYKLNWFERLISTPRNNRQQLPVSWRAIQVVPTTQDIYPTRSLDNNALIQPESREAFARLRAQGGPMLCGPCSRDRSGLLGLQAERWPDDKGMRLDHFLLSPELSEKLADGGVDRWVRGEMNASDHAPAWITLDP